MANVYPNTAGAQKHLEDKIEFILRSYLNNAIQTYNSASFLGSDYSIPELRGGQIKCGRYFQTENVQNAIDLTPTVCFYIRSSPTLSYDVLNARDVKYSVEIGVYDVVDTGNPQWSDKRASYLRDIVLQVLETYLTDPTGVNGVDGSISIYRVDIDDSGISPPVNVGNSMYVVNASGLLGVYSRVTYESNSMWLGTELLKNIPWIPSLATPQSSSIQIPVAGSGSLTSSIPNSGMLTWTIGASDITNVGDGLVLFNPDIPNGSSVFLNYTKSKLSAFDTIVSGSITIPSGSLQAAIDPSAFINILTISSGTDYQNNYTIRFDVV